MPSLEKLSSKHDKGELKVLLINIGESAEKVASFMNERGNSNTVLFDNDGVVSRKYQAIGVPISFVIDKNGKIVDRLVGYVNWESSKNLAALDNLISKQ